MEARSQPHKQRRYRDKLSIAENLGSGLATPPYFFSLLPATLQQRTLGRCDLTLCQNEVLPYNSRTLPLDAF